jgi:hypothetical protein
MALVIPQRSVIRGTLRLAGIERSLAVAETVDDALRILTRRETPEA